MPWINKNDCTGCGSCVEACPVNTIVVNEGKGEIEMEACIHCGICHNICPENAVRHDSEKISDEINSNILRTKKYMNECEKYLGDLSEKKKCLNRMIKYFTKEKIVVEKTIKELQLLLEEQ